jgi:hypothetical protein
VTDLPRLTPEEREAFENPWPAPVARAGLALLAERLNAERHEVDMLKGTVGALKKENERLRERFELADGFVRAWIEQPAVFKRYEAALAGSQPDTEPAA